MANITLNIPDNKLARVKVGLLALHPNVELDEEGDPKYNDNAWLKEVIRRYIITSVHRGEQIIAKAESVSTITQDDTLAS
jgi:hypothetical protein